MLAGHAWTLLISRSRFLPSFCFSKSFISQGLACFNRQIWTRTPTPPPQTLTEARCSVHFPTEVWLYLGRFGTFSPELPGKTDKTTFQKNWVGAECRSVFLALFTRSNRRFRKGVGRRGLATNKPPKRAQKVFQKFVPFLLRGHRKKGKEKRPESLAFEGLPCAKPFSKLLIKGTIREQKTLRHIRKSHKISEEPPERRVSVGHPAGVPAKMPVLL